MKKSKKRTVTPKRKAKQRRIKLKYVCTAMQVSVKKFMFEVPNEHGAVNEEHRSIPCYELQFHYAYPHHGKNEVPRVVESIFIHKTTDKSIYDSYMVGQEYDKLPE